MSFLHLSLLAGLGTIAVPILLHLFGRRQPQIVDFPALRFVKETSQEQSSSWQLRHMLLLLLRILLLAALALALARPRVHSAMLGSVLTLSALAACGILASLIAAVAIVSRRPKSIWLTAAVIALALWIAAALWGIRAIASGPQVPSSDQTAPVAAVLIVDNGPTMEYRTDNATRLDIAKDMGRWILDQLPIDSHVAILTDVPVGTLALDPSTAKSQLKIIEARGGHVDLLGRIRTGLDLVLASELERKEIYVMTDLMSSSWSAAQADLPKMLEEHAAEVLVQLIDVGKEDTANYRLGNPIADFETVPVGGEVAIEIELFQPSGASRETLAIELIQEQIDPTLPVILDGKLKLAAQKVVDRQSAEFSESKTARVTLRARELAAGTHNFTIRMDAADPLANDNERYVSVLAQAQRPTLIVADDEGVGLNLQAVVDPQAVGASGGETTQVDRVSYAQLANVQIEKYAVICLYDPTPISTNMAQSLEEHIRRGAGLFLILGPGLGSLENVQGNPLTQLLPGEIAESASREVSQPTVYPEPVAITHPIFFALGQSPDEVLWNLYPVYRNWTFSALAEDVQTLIKLSDGSAPFLTLQNRGRGQILTLTTPIPEFDTAKRRIWNTLWVSDPIPAFAILLGAFRTLSGASQADLNYEVGQMVSLSNDSQDWPSRYDLYTPDVQLRRATAADGVLSLGEMERPGTYRLRGQLQEPILRAVSLNVPTSDTVLERMSETALEEQLGKGNYRVARNQDEVESSVGQARFGRELYPLLMVLVAGLFLGEQAMSNRFYKVKFR